MGFLPAPGARADAQFWPAAGPEEENACCPRTRTENLPATPSADKDGHSLPSDQCLGRKAVLRKREDFALVRNKGRRINGRLIACNYLPGNKNRMAAFIVPKRCGIAVTRNRIRRRLREIYRRLQKSLPPDLWSVWIARTGIQEASYRDLKDEMIRLYGKAGLLAHASTE